MGTGYIDAYCIEKNHKEVISRSASEVACCVGKKETRRQSNAHNKMNYVPSSSNRE